MIKSIGFSISSLCTAVNACLLSSLIAVAAVAQTATPAASQPSSPAAPEQVAAPTSPTAPAALNLDSDQVAKEMSKEKFSGDTKPDTLSNSQTLFERSILNTENQKKVTGMVSAGASVGAIPAQHGFKGATINCENTAVAINDAISPTTQVAIAAGVDTCRVH